MAIQKEIWQADIVEAVWKNNEFLNETVKADSYVVAGKIVHIPQAGTASKVEKNRTILPAAVNVRKDSEVLYAIDEYTTDPVRIPNADNYELSYDKRNSVIGEDKNALANEVAEGMLMNFINSPADSKAIPAGRILLSSGQGVDATAPAATGGRKAFTLKDFQVAKSYFRKENRWSEGNMCALITPEAEAQLFPADSMVTATYMAQVSAEERAAGVMYKVQGFKIYVRSTVYILDNNGAFKPHNAVGAATDDEAILFWNKFALESVQGQVEAFESLNEPTYYGDIYSFLVRMGGRARIEGYKGVLVMKQAKA